MTNGKENGYFAFCNKYILKYQAKRILHFKEV